jgi:hypothetical protein
MAYKHDTPPFTRQSSDTMKELDDSTTNAINIPDKVESEKTPADDTHSGKDDSDKEREETKEEQKGSMKDFFVSRQNQCDMPGIS